MGDYFKSIQADVVVVSESAKVVDNQDLNKELGDAGYQPLGQTKAAIGGTAPGASKMSSGRKDTKTKQTNVFDKLGVYTSIRPKKKKPEEPQKPKESPKSQEADTP